MSNDRRAHTGPTLRLEIDVWMVSPTDSDTSVPLVQWIGWAEMMIRRLRDEGMENRRALEETRAEIGQLRAALSNADLAGISARVDQLDGRLSEVLARANEATAESFQTAADMSHHDRAAEYHTFVEQDIGLLSVEIIQSGTRLSPRERALLVADVCGLLFGPGEIDQSRVVETVNKRTVMWKQLEKQIILLCTEAKTLRKRIASGREQRWDFGCHRGHPIDPALQDLWPGSALNGVIDFVVVPAYTVDDDQPLTKQQVFTIDPGQEADL